MFKSRGKFRYLGIEDFPKEFLREGFAVNLQFPENKTGEIAAGTYLYSIQQIGNGTLLIVNNYILGLI